MTQGATVRQDRLLDILRASPTTPSYRQLSVAMNLRSMSAISSLIEGLEARGLIERLPHKARSIRVVEDPRPFVESLFDEPTDALIAEIRRRGFIVAKAS